MLGLCDRDEFAAAAIANVERSRRDAEIRAVDADDASLDQFAQPRKRHQVVQAVGDVGLLQPLEIFGGRAAAAKVTRAGLTPAEYLEKMEQASVVNSLDNLMTFPRLRKLIERGAVTLHGAYFGVARGELSVLDKSTGEFRPVAARDTRA